MQEGTILRIGSRHAQPRLTQRSAGFAEVGVDVACSVRHVGTKRELAPAFQFSKNASLQFDGVDGVGVGEGLDQRQERVAFTHLQGEGALGRCGHEAQGVQHVDV